MSRDFAGHITVGIFSPGFRCIILSKTENVLAELDGVKFARNEPSWHSTLALQVIGHIILEDTDSHTLGLFAFVLAYHRQSWLNSSVA
jgi:hypothetical protein